MKNTSLHIKNEKHPYAGIIWKTHA